MPIPLRSFRKFGKAGGDKVDVFTSRRFDGIILGIGVSKKNHSESHSVRSPGRSGLHILCIYACSKPFRSTRGAERNDATNNRPSRRGVPTPLVRTLPVSSTNNAWLSIGGFHR